MSNVISLHRPKRFTLDEAKELLPRVREVTANAVIEARPLIAELESDRPDEEERPVLSRELQECIEAWSNEISALGALTKGLWLVDFDSGGGYYCWKYDEPDVTFFHGYDEGFTQRIPIQ